MEGWQEVEMVGDEMLDGPVRWAVKAPREEFIIRSTNDADQIWGA